MSNVDEIKSSISRNMVFYRKQKNITQLELAEMLNYSDKAVSKWERGESVPDVTVLKKLADFYGITIDDLTCDEPPKKHQPSIQKLLTMNKLIIPILSAGLVWLIATIIYVFLRLFGLEYKSWLVFVYAVPLSLIVLMIFNAIWGNKIASAVIISFFVWSIPLCIVLTASLTEGLLLFMIPAPLQVLIILWYIMRIRKAKLKQ